MKSVYFNRGGIPMDIFQRLDHLSQSIISTFQPAFIFLVHPDKVQHFPARKWTKEQVLEALDTRLGPDYTLDTWNGMVIAVAQNKRLIAILPKYTTVSSLKEA